MQLTAAARPTRLTVDLHAPVAVLSALLLVFGQAAVMLLFVNVLSNSYASNLTDTYKLRNNNFGETTSLGHFQPIQGELLIRYRN